MKTANPAARAREAAREALRRSRESTLTIAFTATSVWLARAALRVTRTKLGKETG